MRKDLNKYYFNKRGSIIINSNGGDGLNNTYLATILKNLEFYGYTLSKEAIKAFCSLKEEDAVDLYNEIVDILKDAIGFNASKKPLYKNFPSEVMEKDESELYMDAVIYALSSFKVTPESKEEESLPLIGGKRLKVINLGSEEEFMSIFTNLASSKSSISKGDKELLEWFISNYDKKILELLPAEIPFKENLAYITMLCMNLEGAVKYFEDKYKTATDVLRLATAMSGGDISLAENTVFISFKRKERKFLLELLDKTYNVKEEMFKNKDRWIRLGERLHPAEYTKFKRANKGFKAVRELRKIETFNSKLEKAFDEKDIELVIKMLKKKPGEFARRLDRTLRTFDNEKVLNAFDNVSENVATPILLQVREHFLMRNEDKTDRIFFPKGSIGKAFTKEYTLEKLNKETCERAVAICEKALVKNYGEKDNLGKVFISEELKDYKVPTSLRSFSRAVKTISRGSKMKIDTDTNILRLFLYWKDAEKNGDNISTDLDLSATLYRENFEEVKHISFSKLKDEKLGCYHSGDVREAPNGATEFIDLDLDILEEKGVRYIASGVCSYSSVPFIELPECFVGIMERTDALSGEIFEPSTVLQKADIITPSTQCIPMIIDVVERKAIWIDIVGHSSSLTTFNGEGSKNRLLSAVKSSLNCVKPNIYDMVKLNAIARGELVDKKEDADIIFSLEEGITPFDTDILLAEYI